MMDEIKSPLRETPIERGERVLAEINKDYASWMRNKQYGFADRMIRNLIIAMTEVLTYMREWDEKEKDKL